VSNHFPNLPTSLPIKSVTYTLNFGLGVVEVIPALQFSGVGTFLFGALTALGNQGGVQFSFTTPGDPGGFDQDHAETELATVASAVFALVAALTGQDLSTLEANFSVTRTWNWTDDNGNQATYVDEMPVNPANLTSVSMTSRATL
jgi:hypothetical protein